MYEDDFCEITTVCEAQYREEVLQETLKQVQARKVSYQVYYSFVLIYVTYFTFSISRRKKI